MTKSQTSPSKSSKAKRSLQLRIKYYRLSVVCNYALNIIPKELM
jgi:hypothetical protein